MMTKKSKLNKISVHKQSRLFKWCEKTIPYLPFIFKNKRQRVKCRCFFKYNWFWKVQKQLIKTLQNLHKPNYVNISKEINYFPEWELKTNYYGKS